MTGGSCGTSGTYKGRGILCMSPFHRDAQGEAFRNHVAFVDGVGYVEWTDDNREAIPAAPIVTTAGGSFN